MQWNPEQAVHVPEIDAEHQEMFRLAAELRAALLADEKNARLSQLCRRLLAEVTEHLRHEEQMMRDAGYPSYAWHEHQHRTARARMTVLEEKLRGGERQPMFEAIEAIGAWLRDHTSVADRMAGAYLRNYWREKGREPSTEYSGSPRR